MAATYILVLVPLYLIGALFFLLILGGVPDRPENPEENRSARLQERGR